MLLRPFSSRVLKKNGSHQAFHLVWLVVAILFLFSCQSEHVVENPSYQDGRDSTLVNLKYTVKSFTIGDSISNLFESSQIARIGDQQKFLFLDNHRIYQFDWVSTLLEHVIPLDSVGSMDVPSGFAYIGQDSIVTYDYSSHLLSLIDSEGQIKASKILINPANGNAVIDPEIFNRSRLAYVDGKIYLSGRVFGLVSDFSKDERVASVGVEFQSYEIIPFPYSDLYYQIPFGLYFNTVSHTVDDKNRFLLGFPCDHYVHRYSPGGEKIDSLCVGSKYIFNTVGKKPSAEFFSNNNNRVKAFLSQCSYDGLHFDKYSNLVYRVALFPNPNWEAGRFKQPFSIIIADKDLNILGETPVFRDVENLTPNIFPMDRGFALEMIPHDENTISFACFTFTDSSYSSHIER